MMKHMTTMKSAAALAALIAVFFSSGAVFAASQGGVDGRTEAGTAPTDRSAEGPRSDSQRWNGEALAREPVHSARERMQQRDLGMRDRRAAAPSR